MMIIEIECYEGDSYLYGKNITESELKCQIEEAESVCDKEEDNFIELLCRRFGWTIFESDELPDFIYDRDIRKLRKNK